MTKDAALKKVNSSIRKLDAESARVSFMRADAEDAVISAIDSGATFREIATTAGRSVSWVQSVLYRRAPERVNRRESSTVASDKLAS
jgi:cyanate lyase